MARRQTPILIGVADVINRSRNVADAIEPLELMLQAIELAIKDTGLLSSAASELQAAIDSISVIRSWTWPYPDLPALLSKRLGVEPINSFYSPHSGKEVARLFDAAARSISFGETKVAIVVGGEALASLTACAAAKKMPPAGWTKLDQDLDAIFNPSVQDLGETVGATHSIGVAIQVYPLFENGFRAHRGQSIQQNNTESAQLYAEFAKVAEMNRLAWNYGRAETEETIGTVSKKNRMICFPYTLLMNAFNTINLAGACLLTSIEYAKELGIPADRWVYPLGGAGTQDSPNFWERPNYHSSPAISKSLDAG